MKTRATLLSLLTGSVILFGIFMLSTIEEAQHKAKIRAEVESSLSTLGARIESSMNARLFLEKGAIAFVLTHLERDANRTISQDEFSRFGRQFMPELLGIRNISLVQNDIITHAYPLEGNERTIGLDFATIPVQYADVKRVREQRRGLLIGPVDIVQGGAAVIHRTPIYWTPHGKTEEVYWGQSSLVMLKDRIFVEAGIQEKERALQIVVRNSENGRVLWGTSFESLSEPVTVAMHMPTGTWQLAAVPVGGWGAKSPYFLVIWFWGTALAFASGALVLLLLRARTIQESLRLSEERFRILFEKAPVLINSTDHNGNMLLWNAEAEKCLGYSISEIKGMPHPLEQLYPTPGEANRVRAVIAKSEGVFEEFRPIAKDGTQRVQIWADMRLPNGDGLSVGHDVTEQKRAEEALRESEEQFRQMFTKQKAIMFLLDPDSLRILDANEASQQYYGYSAEQFRRLTVMSLSVYSEEQIRQVVADIVSGEFECNEVQHRLASNEIRDVEVRATVIELQTRKFIFAIVHDITERKQAEAQLKFVSFHDSLTQLYDRTFFEVSILRLDERNSGAIGLIICDLDGLKLANDTLGHEHGDQMLVATATILKSCFPGDAIVARIGGDEFAVILEETSEELLHAACDRIRAETERFNEMHQELHMSVSIGAALGAGPEVPTRDLYKEADNNMYREKLHRGKSARSAIVQTVMKLLAARDFITEGHADRLQEIVVSLGKTVGLQESRQADLRLLAQFHDIGKVGIPDRILLKPGPLSAEEKLEMQRHCEIGHRIALASPDLAPIADWILKHQEWWDGGGYPLGIAGEEIPLECRILAIADAYDAMTSDRPYRKAMPHAEAMAELKRCAGWQFDPHLVDTFVAVWGRKKP